MKSLFYFLQEHITVLLLPCLFVTTRFQNQNLFWYEIGMFIKVMKRSWRYRLIRCLKIIHMTFIPTNQFISHEAICFLTNPKMSSYLSSFPFSCLMWTTWTLPFLCPYPRCESSHPTSNQMNSNMFASVHFYSLVFPPREALISVAERKFLTVVFSHFSLFVSVPFCCYTLFVSIPS